MQAYRLLSTVIVVYLYGKWSNSSRSSSIHLLAGTRQLYTMAVEANGRLLFNNNPQKFRSLYISSKAAIASF